MYILKKYDDNCGKGILIFTHNETSFILQNCSHLLEKYYFIQHVQFNIPSINRNNKISLHFMPQFNVTKSNDINIATNVLIYKKFYYKMLYDDKSNFINLLQRYNINIESSSENKIIDFLYVGRCCELKKTIDILNYFIYCSQKLNKKCLFLLLDQNDKKSSYKNSFYIIYNNLHTSIKKNIVIVDTSYLDIENNPMFHGFNLDDVALFYKNSKIYIHGCEDEGGSRSIHEAICSGCYIMVKSNMKGGGLDNFKDKCQYTLYNDINYKEKITEAVIKQSSYVCNEEYLTEISEIYTLKKMLGILYDKLNYSSILKLDDFIDICEKNTEYIQLKMAAHDLTVPWYVKNELTSTIKNEYQLKKLYQCL